MSEIPWEEIGFGIGVGLVFHLYIAAALFSISKKLAMNQGWLAWIPILNWLLFIRMGQKPWWWFFVMVITFLIPWLEGLTVAFAVIAAASIIIWYRIAIRLGKPGWYGAVMVLLPPFGLFYLAVLAWEKKA